MSYDYDITDYGATAQATSLNTTSIQQAIDACHAAGGGRVVCPPGVYTTGALVLKSFVELHLMAGCRLVGSENLDDYQELEAPGFLGQYAAEGSSKSLIRAVEAEQIAITGPGEINGSGPAFYDTTSGEGKPFYDKPTTARPRMVTLYKCRDVLIEGPAFIDSPCWTCWFMKCERLAIHRLRIDGDPRMINQDGLDIDSCRQVTVSDCSLTTADDSIIVRAINQVYDEPGICEQVTVTNCVLNSRCQGIRIGCPGDGEIRHCTFSNLTISCEGNGITSFHPHRYVPASGLTPADMHDLVFSNIIIDCGKTPINFAVQPGIKLKRFSDFSFSNMRIHSGTPCKLEGNAETTIRNMSFNQVSITTTGEHAITCRYCSGIRMTDVELNNHPATD